MDNSFHKILIYIVKMNTHFLTLSIMISLIEGCCYQGRYWAKGSYWLIWSRHFENFMVVIINDHEYVPFVVKTIRSFPHS
jgi:hypothetical protein